MPHLTENRNMLNKTDILRGYASQSHTLPTAIRWARLVKACHRYFLTVAAIATTVTAGVAIYTLTRPFLYESTASFLIENTNPTNTDYNLSTQINIFKSTEVIATAIAKLKTPIADRTELIRQISENLVIEQAPEARVLKISYRDTSATNAQAIVDVLLKAYKEYGAAKASLPS